MVTSVESKTLLPGEGIEVVDAAFMAEARTRLTELVDRPGLLVLASHSNELLAQLCDTALWVGHGTVRQAGLIGEVVEVYEGKEVADRARRVLA